MLLVRIEGMFELKCDGLKQDCTCTLHPDDVLLSDVQ